MNIIKGRQDRPGRIGAHSPALAGHLNATISTGTYCCCTPDPRAPITWRT